MCISICSFVLGSETEHNKDCFREFVWNEQENVDELELNLIILIFFFIMLT